MRLCRRAAAREPGTHARRDDGHGLFLRRLRADAALPRSHASVRPDTLDPRRAPAVLWFDHLSAAPVDRDDRRPGLKCAPSDPCDPCDPCDPWLCDRWLCDPWLCNLCALCCPW